METGIEGEEGQVERELGREAKGSEGLFQLPQAGVPSSHHTINVHPICDKNVDHRYKFS